MATMSTPGNRTRLAACLLAFLAFPAAAGAAIPVDSAGDFLESQGPEARAAVTGVLGYTATCGLALYGSSQAAAVRNARHAIALPGAKILVGGQLVADDIVGLHVIAGGVLGGSEGAMVLSDPDITYAFGARKQPQPCVAREGVSFVPFSVLLGRRSEYVGQRISTVGYLRVAEDTGAALFLSAETADGNVWTNRVQLASLSPEDPAALNRCATLHASSFVEVVGVVDASAGTGDAIHIHRLAACEPVRLGADPE